jgi:hypothetical protein
LDQAIEARFECGPEEVRRTCNSRFRNPRIVPENKVAEDDGVPELSCSP